MSLDLRSDPPRRRRPGRQRAERTLVERPRLRARLDQVTRVRLCTVIAGPGYGKSTLLRGWARDAGAAWLTMEAGHRRLGSLAAALMGAIRGREAGLPREVAIESGQGGEAETPERALAVASAIAEAVQVSGTGELIVVIDDLHRLAEDDPGAALLAALIRQTPERMHLVLAGRREPPFPIERLRGSGAVAGLDAADLAFDLDEVSDLLEATLDVVDPALAESVLAVTAGWPVAVRLAAEALRSSGVTAREDIIAALDRPGGPLFAYLAQELITTEPQVSRLLRTVAALPRFDAALAAWLGVADAPTTIADLQRRMLFLETVGPDARWLRLHALIRRFVRERMPLDDDEKQQVLRRAAAWLEQHDHLREAAETLDAAPDPAANAAFLERSGARLLAMGATSELLAVAAGVPDGAGAPVIDVLAAEAHLVRGEVERARERLRTIAEPEGRLPARTAWLLGRTYWERGETAQAVAAYERGLTGSGETRDRSLLLSYLASAYWTTGRVEEARAAATSALELAHVSGDPGAVAAAHNPLAVIHLRSDPDAAERHFRDGIEAADRAGDLFQLIRLRTNFGTVLEARGHYDAALEQQEAAVALAELCGWGSALVGALRARGFTRFKLGRLDEAVTDLEAARSTAARTGSGRLTFALRNIGWAHRQLGSLALARAALEQAHEAVVRAKDVQIAIFVLTELALVLAAEDPPRAAALAVEAVADARRLGYAVADALIAAGWVHLAAGDRRSALAEAIEAVDEARAADEPPTLAAAIELRAMASEGSERLALLREAHALWSELGDVPGRLRVELVLGERSPLAEERARGRAAARRLRDLGVRVEQAALAAGVLNGAGVGPQGTLAVRVLGGFSVLVAGRPVPISAWGSRKARDLLKILVARRGRPVPRETLMEILWPGEEPAPLANRLAVAVATVRGVLDPARAHDTERYVGADPESVWLRLDEVSVDVETFLVDAAAGQALLRQGRDSDAVELLEAAEEAYAGDALEEDPYEDWSTGLREEARAAYIGVVAGLAAIARRRGDSEASARYLLRLLARDPYDEGAHLGLVATLDGAGRHGEARRRYRMYVERMRELDVEAAPFPTRPASPD